MSFILLTYFCIYNQLYHDFRYTLYTVKKFQNSKLLYYYIIYNKCYIILKIIPLYKLHKTVQFLHHFQMKLFQIQNLIYQLEFYVCCYWERA